MYAGALPQVIQNHLWNINKQYETTLERLTTGKRINRSADDPSGSYIANSLNTRYRGYTQAYENAQTGINLLQTANDGLNSVLTQLNSFRDLAVEAAAGGTGAQYTAWAAEATAYKSSIDLVVNTTDFNGNKLLNGSVAGAFNLQIGPDNASSNQLDISTAINGNNSVAGLSLTASTLADQTNATSAITAIDAAIASVTAQIAKQDTYSNILNTHSDYLSTIAENMSAAEGTIRNADIAEETTKLSALEILQSSAATSLLKANTNMTLLSLLYG